MLIETARLSRLMYWSRFRNCPCRPRSVRWWAGLVLGVGLAVGALVVRAVTKKAQTLTPGGLAASARDSATGLLDTVRDFIDDIVAPYGTKVKAAGVEAVGV